MPLPHLKTLIVALDLSPYSEQIAKEARDLCRSLKLAPIYVYVFQDTAILKGARSERKDDIRRSCEAQVRSRYQLKNKERVIIKFGIPYEQILSVARAHPQPLILAGHRGHSVLQLFFLGSTAEKLARFSAFPVWIHHGTKSVVPRKILVPCDLSSRSRTTITKIKPLQTRLRAELELFHVMEEPLPILDYQVYGLVYEQVRKADEKSVREFHKHYPDLPVRTTIGGVVSGIERRARNFDLIALSPRSRKSSFPLLGSVTTRLLRSAKKPVLVIP